MADNIGENLPFQLRRLRRLLGLTQEELAEKVGATRGQYANWENGVARPPEHYLSLLAELGLGKNAADFAFPLRVRATRRQLQLLIDILSDTSVNQALRETARLELIAALTLDSEEKN